VEEAQAAEEEAHADARFGVVEAFEEFDVFQESERSELTDSPKMNPEDESRVWRVGGSWSLLG